VYEFCSLGALVVQAPLLLRQMTEQKFRELVS
jgi:hypothetical protein